MAEDTKKNGPCFSRSLAPEVRLAVRAVLEKKGEGVRVLDLRTISSFTDYFVIAHGNSSRQNAALADGVEQELKQAGVAPLGVEGRTTGSGSWTTDPSSCISLPGRPATITPWRSSGETPPASNTEERQRPP
jgi:ribosome silencing factor RsfS/YbeB/iojap